jgi:hypothetical protein
VPLFSTVGIDHSFYQPASTRQLAHYAEQVPEHFRFCSKVWEEITIPAFANPPRYGAKAGKPNPRFLDTGAFRNLVRSFLSFSAGAWSLTPFLKRWTDFSAHCHQDHSTQQKSAIPQFLDRVT